MDIAWAPVAVELADEIADEPLGTKVKFWVVDPADQSVWLFKLARVRHGRTLGEDWAEWIVHHLARELGVPSADIRPALCDGRRGIMSRRINDPSIGERLELGNSLLTEVVNNYDSAKKRENPQYTVRAVKKALKSCDAPRGFTGPASMSAFDVWSGYLLLDAWVAGRDRHHENWGVVSSNEARKLAPSFDHGNALGFQETDAQVRRLGADREGLQTWLNRGRSHHFAGRPPLVDLAREALAAASSEARAYWSQQIKGLDFERVRTIVRTVPTSAMSEVTHRFALNILEENRERLIP